MLSIETGVAVVLTDVGEVRASYAGRMLGRVAGDPLEAPRAGDWVDLRAWPDGRVTIEDCPTARSSSRAGAVVLPLRAARRHG